MRFGCRRSNAATCPKELSWAKTATDLVDEPLERKLHFVVSVVVHYPIHGRVQVSKRCDEGMKLKSNHKLGCS